MPSIELGRFLIFLSLALTIAGVVLVSGARIPFFGRLAGGLRMQIGGGAVTLLIGTSMLPHDCPKPAFSSVEPLECIVSRSAARGMAA